VGRSGTQFDVSHLICYGERFPAITNFLPLGLSRNISFYDYLNVSGVLINRMQSSESRGIRQVA